MTCRAVTWAFLACLLGCSVARASGWEDEYVLKAQILLGMLPYVQWEGTSLPAGSSFQVGVFGRSPFGPALDLTARTLTIQRRPIAIHYVTRLEDLEGCRAVFISPSERGRVDQVVAWARGRRVLTVADTEVAVRKGVMVVLLLEGSHVRLLVNLGEAQRQGLTLGSLLLRNARILGSEPRHP